jgi:hypothetical protein
MGPVKLLLINASIQILISSLLGFLLLIPMQPWGKNFLNKVRNLHDLRSTHLDWLMLAFMQYGAAFALMHLQINSPGFIASLLVFGGWMNATPYLVRGLWGFNAFSLSGDGKQIFAASVGLISVVAIITAWSLIVIDAFAHH